MREQDIAVVDDDVRNGSRTVEKEKYFVLAMRVEFLLSKASTRWRGLLKEYRKLSIILIQCSVNYPSYLRPRWFRKLNCSENEAIVYLHSLQLLELGAPKITYLLNTRVLLL